MFLPRKAQDFAENSRFPFVYLLCVGIPILKIVLLHAHKWVTFDVILFKNFFSLVMSSSGGPGMVNG